MTAETVGQISSAVHDMAEGASSQANDTQTATESVIVIGNMVDETNDEVAKLRENVEVMKTSGEEAEQTLKELEEINEEAKQSIVEIYNQTNTTNESAQKIKDAITLITSIAEETNLLSLNASIEASACRRAGTWFCGSGKPDSEIGRTVQRIRDADSKNCQHAHAGFGSGSRDRGSCETDHGYTECQDECYRRDVPEGAG